jgi:hypothetical protein
MKLKSRKFFALIVWIAFVAVWTSSGVWPPEYIVKYFGLVTIIYVFGQAAIDAIIQWKHGFQKEVK